MDPQEKDFTVIIAFGGKKFSTKVRAITRTEANARALAKAKVRLQVIDDNPMVVMEDFVNSCSALDSIGSDISAYIEKINEAMARAKDHKDLSAVKQIGGQLVTLGQIMLDGAEIIDHGRSKLDGLTGNLN